MDGRILTGWIMVIFSAILIVISLIKIIFLLIYGIPILIIGLFILFNRKEDVIEEIKNSVKSNRR